MSYKPAIKFENVSKIYKLYSSNLKMALDLLGLSRFIRKDSDTKAFQALNCINLEVKKGERLGIIGRNGAGKSTLLKLVTGAFSPTSGQLIINGEVQSLMDSGVGFHPDFTGRQNIYASLNYNGLSPIEIEVAAKEIIDFVELGDFLDQPIRTYSLGMRARLGFATATAIKPDILIIDEVLSAGDGYFANKCVDRIRKLTQAGTTLLLVSHSNQQILQFCDRALWLDGGSIKEDGLAIEVVKNYERYIRQLDEARLNGENQKALSLNKANLVEDTPSTKDSLLSRWPGKTGPKIERFSIFNKDLKIASVFDTGDKVHFVFDIGSQIPDTFSFKLVLMIYASNGSAVTMHLSEEFSSDFEKEPTRAFTLTYDNLLLGNGEYFVSLAIYKKIDQTDLSTAETYDLLDRSFKFKVISPIKSDPSIVIHPSLWSKN